MRKMNFFIIALAMSMPIYGGFGDRIKNMVLGQLKNILGPEFSTLVQDASSTMNSAGVIIQNISDNQSDIILDLAPLQAKLSNKQPLDIKDLTNLVQTTIPLIINNSRLFLQTLENLGKTIKDMLAVIDNIIQKIPGVGPSIAKESKIKDLKAQFETKILDKFQTFLKNLNQIDNKMTGINQNLNQNKIIGINAAA